MLNVILIEHVTTNANDTISGHNYVQNRTRLHLETNTELGLCPCAVLASWCNPSCFIFHTTLQPYFNLMYTVLKRTETRKYLIKRFRSKEISKNVGMTECIGAGWQCSQTVQEITIPMQHCCISYYHPYISSSDTYRGPSITADSWGVQIIENFQILNEMT